MHDGLAEEQPYTGRKFCTVALRGTVLLLKKKGHETYLASTLLFGCVIVTMPTCFLECFTEVGDSV